MNNEHIQQTKRQIMRKTNFDLTPTERLTFIWAGMLQHAIKLQNQAQTLVQKIRNRFAKSAALS